MKRTAIALMIATALGTGCYEAEDTGDLSFTTSPNSTGFPCDASSESLVSVHNYTGRDIVYIYFSYDGDEYWDEILGDETLRDDQAAEFCVEASFYSAVFFVDEDMNCGWFEDEYLDAGEEYTWKLLERLPYYCG